MLLVFMYLLWMKLSVFCVSVLSVLFSIWCLLAMALLLCFAKNLRISSWVGVPFLSWFLPFCLWVSCDVRVRTFLKEFLKCYWKNCTYLSRVQWNFPTFYLYAAPNAAPKICTFFYINFFSWFYYYYPIKIIVTFFHVFIASQ